MTHVKFTPIAAIFIAGGDQGWHTLDDMFTGFCEVGHPHPTQLGDCSVN